MNAVTTITERDMNKEAWLWYRLTSVEFAQTARQVMQDFLTYYIEIAQRKGALGTGRTDQIAQTAARFVRDYDAAIELMKHGDYESIRSTSALIQTDWSQISSWVLPLPWLSEEEDEVFGKFFGRASAFANVILVMLNNALTAWDAFQALESDPEVANRDDGPICADILLKLPYLTEERGYPPPTRSSQRGCA